MKENLDLEHYKTILNSIADGVFTVDTKWRVTLFNHAAEEITGFKRSEAIGRHCFEVFQADICQKNCALKNAIATRKSIVNLPITIITKYGEELPVSISTAVLENSEHEIVGGVETFRDLSSVEKLRKEIKENYCFEDIISKNYKMKNIFNILHDVAKSDSTVLLTGESGTGKELFARAIHNLSFRAKKPYIPVHCGTLPETLLESELFGYMRGAFTNALRDKPGRFTLAEGGTIFLDEIGDISQAIQAKLLRILQEKEYTPLGATHTHKANVRIIAATNRNLYQLVRHHAFREDLYYRLNILKLHLPPLRDRKDDIPLLVDHFIGKFNLLKGKNIQGVANEVLSLLMSYDYSGNIRELENIIEHAFVLCKTDFITLSHLPEEIIIRQVSDGKLPVDTNPSDSGTPFQVHTEISPLAKAEAENIITYLQRCGGSISKTAKELGIHRSTLWRKIKKHGISYR